MIKLENVSKIFDVSGKKLTALDNVNLAMLNWYWNAVISA